MAQVTETVRMILGATLEIFAFGVLMLAACALAIVIGGAAYAAGQLALERLREKKGD